MFDSASCYAGDGDGEIDRWICVLLYVLLLPREELSLVSAPISLRVEILPEVPGGHGKRHLYIETSHKIPGVSKF